MTVIETQIFRAARKTAEFAELAIKNGFCKIKRNFAELSFFIRQKIKNSIFTALNLQVEYLNIKIGRNKVNTDVCSSRHTPLGADMFVFSSYLFRQTVSLRRL